MNKINDKNVFEKSDKLLLINNNNNQNGNVNAHANDNINNYDNYYNNNNIKIESFDTELDSLMQNSQKDQYEYSDHSIVFKNDYSSNYNISEQLRTAIKNQNIISIIINYTINDTDSHGKMRMIPIAHEIPISMIYNNTFNYYNIMNNMINNYDNFTKMSKIINANINNTYNTINMINNINTMDTMDNTDITSTFINNDQMNNM